jgi:7-cyano-7-deazaguanine synthase in queuosine biosynthesis
MKKPAAVVLLSGGLDSTTVLAMTKSQGFDCYAPQLTLFPANKAARRSEG